LGNVDHEVRNLKKLVTATFERALTYESAEPLVWDRESEIRILAPTRHIKIDGRQRWRPFLITRLFWFQVPYRDRSLSYELTKIQRECPREPAAELWIAASTSSHRRQEFNVVTRHPKRQGPNADLIMKNVS
jgi:hypothetical protein